MNLSRWLVPGMAILPAIACSTLVESTPIDRASERDAAASDADAARAIPWELDLADYDQSCTYNRDCAPVQPGPCRDCICYDAAVNTRERPRYAEAFAAEMSRTQCRTRESTALGACQDVCDYTLIGICTNGRCEVGERRQLDARTYAQSCTTVDDCVAVNENLCDGGSSCTAAIAKSAKAQFDADREAAPLCGTPAPLEPSTCTDWLGCRDGQCGVNFPNVP